MKKLLTFLVAITSLVLSSYCQPTSVPFGEVRKIADQNAAALWGEVSPAAPIAYYAANDELIGYRFNYAIGKPFPEKEILFEQCRNASLNRDEKSQWGIDRFGTMFVSARKDIGVIQDYSNSLSPEYSYGLKMETLATENLGSAVRLKKVYYVNFVNQWFCYTNGTKDVYINVFPKNQVVDRAKFLEITQAMPFFCAKGDFSEEWNAYQTGVPMASKAEVWIPHPEMCKFYDWSYGCTPTAAAMLLSWWDYNSINTEDNYARLIDIYFQRWDGIQGSGETDYQVPNIQYELAVHMNTDTIDEGATYFVDIDPGITEVCNLFNYNNYDFYASTYTAHDVEWYFNKIMEEIGTNHRPILNHIIVDDVGHSECCVAYDAATNMLGVHNTWWEGVQWINRNVLIGCTKVEADGALGLAVTLEHPLGDTEYNHNGNGELFFANDACEIRWDYDEQVNSYIKLSYSVDGGYNWTSITDNTPNDGVFDWHIPIGLNSADCRVHVSVYTSDDVFGGADASVGNFVIMPGGSVQQLQPDIVFYTQSDPDYFQFWHGYTTWCAVGVRSHDDTEWWGIEMFDDDDFDQQLASSYSLGRVEFVVMDGHHSTLNKAVKVNQVIGSENATVEFEGENETLSSGINSLSWPAFDVVEMFDIHLLPGEYTFILSNSDWGPNLDFALFGSNGNAYYAGRQDFLAQSINSGHQDEFFTYEITTEDDYGLCVWANDSDNGNYTIRIEDRETWTGAVSSDWWDEDNWSLNYLPDEYTDVIIPQGTPFAPFISNDPSPAEVKSIDIQQGASLTSENDIRVFGNFISDGFFSITGEYNNLIFYGSKNAVWSDPNEDDDYTDVFLVKEDVSCKVTMTDNMNLSGKLYIIFGTFKIEDPLTLNIGSVSPEAFRSDEGNLTLLEGAEINVNGGMDFKDGSSATITGGVIRCGGDFLVENNIAHDFDFSNLTLVMNGSSDQYIIDEDNGTLEFGSLTVNKTGTCYIDNDHLIINGDLRIEEGAFDLNSHIVLCSGDVDIYNGSTLSVDEYADLGIGQNHILSVHGGGLLEVIGTNDHNAKITVQPEGSGYYAFEVLNNGTISARHGIFERMDANGVYLNSGALVDPANPFNYCTFRDGAAGNTALIVIQNEQNFTVEEAHFPDNTWGGQYNVWKSNNSGNVRFAGATGAFSGQDYEYDPENRVDWVPIFWKADLNIMLEGPFNGINMDANINNRLPEYQPYEPILPYFDNPMPEWYHTGEEFVLSIPNSDIVDWVIVELRDAPIVQQALPGTAISKQAAFVNKSGKIVALDGTSQLLITDSFFDNPFAVVWHRNHLGVISAYPLTQSKGMLSYDFTTGPNKTYGGTEAVKELVPGTWGMISGDNNGNGMIDDADKINAWDTEAGTARYSGSDLNLDFQIDNMDKNDNWMANPNRHSFIPDAFGCGEPFVDTRDGQIYPTVQIGTQCWMAKNLNIGQRIDGSLPQQDNDIFEKYCYNNVETNCSGYGGLYQWNEMMQYSTQPGAQGICPENWRIPTEADWCDLTEPLDPTANCDVTGWDGTDIGIKMKSTSGWNSGGNGTNESGFNALPGGVWTSNFYAVGNYAYIWSSTENFTTEAWYRALGFDNNSIYRYYFSKSYGFSVRCLKDSNQPPAVPTDPSPPDGATNQSINTTLSWSCSDPENDPLTYDVYFGETTPLDLVSTGQSLTSFNPGSLIQNTMYYWKIIALDGQGNSTESPVWSLMTETALTCGEPLIDMRDMQTYNTVQIGTQCWMAENLNIGIMITGTSANNGIIEKFCYGNIATNCDTYGGLYLWDEMMQYSTQPGIQGICPDGWHIPTDVEWCTLTVFIDPTVNCSATGWSGTNAGTKMKSTSGWVSGNGTNTSGFTALPGGWRQYPNYFYAVGYGAYFYSSTESVNFVWNRSLTYNNPKVYRIDHDKGWGYSVRCVKD